MLIIIIKLLLMVPNVSISWFKNPFGAIFLAKNHLFHGGTVADWPPGPWWWTKGFCLFIALMHHLFHFSQSSHVFFLSVECKLSSPPPPPFARLHHFLSISSTDEYHSPPPIILSLSSPPSAIFELLCHFFSICNLDRYLYLPLSVSP